MFDSILKKLNTNLVSHGGKEIKIKSGFEEYFSKRKDTIIQNWLWKVPGFRRWRVTRMDADYTNDHPILGIDLLYFGVKQKLVAVLDFQPLVQDDDYFLRYFSGLRELNTHYKDFNCQRKMNIYDSKKYFSPWVLFYIGATTNLNHSLSNVFDDFMVNYWQINITKHQMLMRL